MRMKHGARIGFSLIELLIVVAIILIIAAIAIPNLLRSRIASNEASAVATIRTLNTAEATFMSTYNSGYSDTLTRLGSPSSGSANINNADLVDPVLSGATGGTSTSFTKNGYVFTYAPSGTFGFITTYTVTSVPQVRGSTGQRSFYSDQSVLVRSNSTATATVSDSPI